MSLLSVLGHKHQEHSDAVLLISKRDCTEPSTYTPIYSKAQKQVALKENLQLSSEKRFEIFHKTRRKREDEKWFIMRRRRITGSICGTIRNSSKVFLRSILKSVLFIASVNNKFQLVTRTTSQLQLGMKSI